MALVSNIAGAFLWRNKMNSIREVARFAYLVFAPFIALAVIYGIFQLVYMACTFNGGCQ